MVRVQILRWLLAFLVWPAWSVAAAVQPLPLPLLQLDERPAVPAWPAVSLLADPGHALGIDAVLARRDDFRAPQGTPSNLGRVDATVWLRIPVHVPGTTSVRRVLEIDYPALNHIDVFVVRGAQVQQQHRLGNDLPFAARPLPSRSHAVALLLDPGAQELLLRVRSSSSMVLPVTLRTFEDFTAHEAGVQLLQGLLIGLALCMLVYSLAHWFSLRDRIFLQYALLVGGNVVFLVSYFGLGPQYLWRDWPQLSQQIAPLAVLVAVAAAAAFLRGALDTRALSRSGDLALRGIGWAALASLLLAPLGLAAYPLLQTLATVLGLASTAVALPLLVLHVRRGERVAVYMLVGWACYVTGAVVMAALLRGFIEPTLAAQHFYAFSALAEMSTWMLVLGLRVQSLHRSADRARVESEALRALAHTDALTGLPNRRSLEAELSTALPQAGRKQQLAVYLLDLDGFKAVNDLHGHDAGDALLAAAADRLRRELRHSDSVARLGGDEFVVLARGLGGEADAWALGRKLVAAFEVPFIVQGVPCRVGLTVGFALAPDDGGDAMALLRRADAAMYAGKQAGKGTVRRADARQLDAAAA